MSFFSMLSSVFHKEIKEPVPAVSPLSRNANVSAFSDSTVAAGYTIQTGESEFYRTKTSTLSNLTYRVLSYELGKESAENKNYRSVIVDDSTGRVLSFSQARSLSAEEFSDANPDLSNSSKYLATKTIEGTMIQLFHDSRKDGFKWEIATRSAVGCNYSFFRKTPKKTFRDMFLDAFNEQSAWDNEEYGNITRDMSDIEWFESLDTNYSYTFVLQHPDNHLVFPVLQPKLYLTSVHEIGEFDEFENTQKIRFVPFSEYSEWKSIQTGVQCGILHFPDMIPLQTTVQEYYAAHCSSTKSADKVGMMICDQTTGERVSLENEGYKTLKELRGNNSDFISNYVRLMKNGKIKDFMIAFPMYKDECYKLYSVYHNLITQVHAHYIDYYVHKNKSPIEKSLFIQVARIHHNIYLNSEQEKPNTKITHRVVRQYFDEMDEATLFHLMKKYYEYPVEQFTA
jgi:hypothetical protein